VERLLTFNDLKRFGVVTNRTSLANWIRNDSFPLGRLIGPNRRVWTETEIRQFIAERPTEPKKFLEGRRPGRPRKARSQSQPATEA
jgi:predicted DNA-binding transcriptional regulator AlpA